MFLTAQKNKKSLLVREKKNKLYSYHKCLANKNVILVFDYTFLYLLQMMFYQKFQI